MRQYCKIQSKKVTDAKCSYFYQKIHRVAQNKISQQKKSDTFITGTGKDFRTKFSDFKK